MAFALEQTIGGYEFLDVLETSRGSRTYKVNNSAAHRMEKLKVFPKEMQNDRERAERFLREIKIHASLSHPNIAAFYDAAYLNGELVMTSELVDGMTLMQRLAAGAMPPLRAVEYMCQVLAALAYAHEHGVVHRMISPAVILITPDETLKLTGFDLAKTATDPQLTQAGIIMGELEYMSPEQVKGAAKLDARSDIYSAGVVLYEMATGRVPFASKNQFELMMAHVNTAPPPPREINPDFPADLEKIIFKAIAKDPEQRFQTAGQFREALMRLRPWLARDAIKKSLPPLAPKTPAMATKATDSSDTEPLVQPASWLSRNLVLAGVFTFFVVAVAFFVLLSFQHH
jgi:serine/threonine-protein kinase